MEQRLTSIRLIRPKKPSTFRFRTWSLPENWAGSRLLFLGWFLALGLLAYVPSQWLNDSTAKEEDAWFEMALAQAGRITQAFCGKDDPGPLSRGDEPGALRILAHNPLNYAVADPGAGKIWVRDGARLVPMVPGGEARELLSWAAMARASGRMTWSPQETARIFRPASFTLVPEPSGLVVVKRWLPGSQEVDAFLKRVLNGHLPVRFGLVRFGRPRAGPPAPSTASSDGWDLQVVNLEGLAPFRQVPGQKQYYADLFTPVVRMPDRVYRDQLRVRKLRGAIAWGLYAFGAMLSGSVLLLLVQGQARKQMDSKCLAALAHSLKTPLAMMKMRCDSALNANLSQERQVAHLLRVGDGVEKLLHIIEHGLEPFRAHGSARPDPVFPKTFFPEIEAEFRPAFEELGRTLVVDPGLGTLRTRPSSLRSAVSILVENALLHGLGTVRLTTAKGARGMVVQVHDEGSGIKQDRLALLKEPGGESVEAMPTALGISQGLGLDLLASLARREGWGLLLEYPPEGGFSVSIEIPG